MYIYIRVFVCFVTNYSNIRNDIILYIITDLTAGRDQQQDRITNKQLLMVGEIRI